MPVKRMVTKLAPAFAAKKGVEAFRSAGGLQGVKSMLAGNRTGPQGTQARTAQGTHGTPHGTQPTSAGGLEGLLGSLGGSLGARAGMGGGAGAGAAGAGSLGGLFGALAGMTGGTAPQTQDARTLDAHLSDDALESDAAAGPVLRAMVQMARADGTIDATERAALDEILHDATPTERSAYETAMAEPVDAAALARDTPPSARKEVYSAALLVGDPDTPAEQTFLRDLAYHLELSASDVMALHQAMGKPAG